MNRNMTIQGVHHSTVSVHNNHNGTFSVPSSDYLNQFAQIPAAPNRPFVAVDTGASTYSNEYAAIAADPNYSYSHQPFHHTGFEFYDPTQFVQISAAPNRLFCPETNAYSNQQAEQQAQSFNYWDHSFAQTFAPYPFYTETSACPNADMEDVGSFYPQFTQQINQEPSFDHWNNLQLAQTFATQNHPFCVETSAYSSECVTMNDAASSSAQDEPQITREEQSFDYCDPRFATTLASQDTEQQINQEPNCSSIAEEETYLAIAGRLASLPNNKSLNKTASHAEKTLEEIRKAKVDEVMPHIRKGRLEESGEISGTHHAKTFFKMTQKCRIGIRQRREDPKIKGLLSVKYVNNNKCFKKSLFNSPEIKTEAYKNLIIEAAQAAGLNFSQEQANQRFEVTVPFNGDKNKSVDMTICTNRRGGIATAFHTLPSPSNREYTVSLSEYVVVRR